MAKPENELFRGVNSEFSREIPINEDLFSSKNQEIDEEQAVLQPETQSQEILPPPESHEQVGIRLSQEREPFPKQPQKESLRALLLGKIMEKWRKREISKEEKKKSLIALKQLWPVHGVVCATGFAAIALRFGPHFLRTQSLASLLWKMRTDPLLAAYILIPGVIKLVTTFAYEKRYGVKFSMLSKGISLWPFVGGGSAMPIEVAYTLGEGPWLVNKIKERYLAIPLTRAQSAAQKVRGFFRR